MICPHCGSNVNDSSKFCIHCGNQILGVAPVQNAQPLNNNASGYNPYAYSDSRNQNPQPYAQAGTAYNNPVNPQPYAQANQSYGNPYNAQPYAAPMQNTEMPKNVKDYANRFADKRVRSEITASSIILYVCAGITLIMNLIQLAGGGNMLGFLDVLMLAGLGVWLQLTYSKIPAIIALVYGILNIILIIVITNSVGGWLPLIAGIFATIYTIKVDKEYKNYIAGQSFNNFNNFNNYNNYNNMM